jgi:hypothetical protein
MIAVIGWIGAALMCAASFNIDSDIGKASAIAGLVLLTLQAVSNRCYNLVLLNAISIGGFSYALYL